MAILMRLNTLSIEGSCRMGWKRESFFHDDTDLKEKVSLLLVGLTPVDPKKYSTNCRFVDNIERCLIRVARFND